MGGGLTRGFSARPEPKCIPSSPPSYLLLLLRPAPEDLKFENGLPSHFENGLPSIRLAGEYTVLF